MIAVIEAPNKATYAAIASLAFMRGVEYQPLAGLQMEIWGADDVRVESILNKYRVTILHIESTKIVTGDEI